MATREGGAGGAGAATPAEAGSKPAGTEGGAAAQPSASPGGTGAVVTQSSGVSGISLDLLPQELQDLVKGRPAAEQRQIFNNMVNSLKTANRRLQELERKPAAAPVEEKPAKPADSRTPEERILENAEETIAEIVERRYGSRFANTEQQVGNIVYQTVRSEDPEFAEYEEDVKEILRESGAPATYENINAAYSMVIGQKTLQQKRRKVSEIDNSDRPREEAPAPASRQYSELEKEIAAAHRMTPEQYFAEDSWNIKVPTGPKKEAANG